MWHETCSGKPAVQRENCASMYKNKHDLLLHAGRLELYMKCTYHDQVSPQYQWLQNDYEMEDKTYAILYICVEYKCRVTVDKDIHDGGVFSVTGHWYV